MHPALATDVDAPGEEEARPASARLALLGRLLPRLLAAGRRVLLLSQSAPALDLLQARSLFHTAFAQPPAACSLPGGQAVLQPQTLTC